MRIPEGGRDSPGPVSPWPLDPHIRPLRRVGVRRPGRRRLSIPTGHAACTPPIRLPTLDLSFPNDYPDQTHTDRLPHPSPMGSSRRRPRTPTTCLYELDAKGPGFTRVAHRASLKAVVFHVWQNVAALTPNLPKQHNWDFANLAPSTFGTAFVQPGTKPVDLILTLPSNRAWITAWFDRRQPSLPPSVVGLDPSMYQNFSRPPTALLFFFIQGYFFCLFPCPVQASVPLL